MDGTILNTLDDIANSVNYTFKHFNLPEVSKMQVRAALGNGANRLISDLLKNLEVSNLEEIVNFYLNYYSQNSNILTKPYEGILKLLQNLKPNYKLAVVSNKSDHLVKSLNANLFEGLFDLSIGELKGVKKKPDPEMLNLAMKKLGANATNTIFIGDSEVDIKTGENANLPVIAVTWGFRDKAHLVNFSPNYIVNTPLDILNIINNFNWRTSFWSSFLYPYYLQMIKKLLLYYLKFKIKETYYGKK